MEVVASLSQGRTAAAQCGLFTHKSVPVIFETPCMWVWKDSTPLLCVPFTYLVQKLMQFNTRWRSWLGHCATRWKAAGSIADGVIGIFH